VSAADGTVAAVLPLFNEGPIIADLVHRMPGEIAETIVVDDGSTDAGPELARAAGATVIRLGRRRGVGAAIRAGILAARTHDHWAVVVLAGNGKDDPAEVPLLVERLRAGDDYVQGSRFLAGGSYRNLPRGRFLMIKGYTRIFRVLIRKAGTDVTNGFRAYRLGLLDDPRIDIEQEWLDHYELEYYLHYKAMTRGYRTSEVPVSKTYPSAPQPYSKIRPFRDWWSIIRPVVLLRLGLRR
jgi:dolichol-phosphate mannosyltransferase